MPARYHSIHKNDLARAIVAQSEQAFLALVQGKGPAAPAVEILEYKGPVERESAVAYGFPPGEGARRSTSLSAFMSTGLTMW